MSFKKIISQNLIFPQLKAANWQQVIQALGDALQSHGYVQASYTAAVIEREGVFPTGLPLGEINVAIPHTDVVHVIEPAIAVATLAQPVAFGNMDDPGSSLPIRIVFLLAMKEPHTQVDLLQSLVETFQNPQILKGLADACDAKEVEAVLMQKLFVKEAG